MKTKFSNKRIISLFVVCMCVFSFQAQTIKHNSVYKITFWYADRVLGTLNSSLDQNQDIVTYTSTGSNSQSWRISFDESELAYTITNVGADKFFYLYSLEEGIKLRQVSFSLNGSDKWKIAPVNDPAYPGCFYIYNTKLTSDNKKLYIEVPETYPISGAEGQAVRVMNDPENGTKEPRRFWKFEEVEDLPNAPTRETVNQTFAAWKAKYYKPATYGYLLGSSGFWYVAEMLEILLDAYETTGHAEYKTMFYNVYDNFYKTQGNKNGDWMSNPYNDDIAWMVISCTRAFILFRDTKFLTIAKSHFDRMYARALLSHGGLRWKEGDGDGSNSCINGPAQVAACYLAKAIGDNTYYTKAKKIFDYQYRVLYDRNSGRVYDSALGETVTNTWASTYNQGTFIGANLMLYEYYGDPLYLSVADKVATYTKNAMYANKVINNESGRDLDGFKGILMRYYRKYIVDYLKTNFIPWLHLNAKIAFNNRNSDGIIGTLWGTKTPEVSQDAFAASTAVSLMVNTPLLQDLKKNPFDIIEAEDFDYISGPIAEDCPDGTENIGNTQNNYYVGYMNVDFGTATADKAEFRISSIAAGGSIEVRLGSQTGQLIGKADLPATTDWKSYVTVSCDIANVTGLQHIFLVFKGTGYIVNLNWFYFLDSKTEVEKVYSTNFQVYPNILHRGENLFFQFANNDLLKIYSANGKLVVEKKLQNSGFFSTGNLHPGIYFLRLENTSEINQSKFIVK